MGGMLEIFLKMNERTSRLDQPLKEIVVDSVAVEPKVFHYIVRFVIALLVPAPKISAIKRIPGHLARKIGIVAREIADELRNSFAFVHEAFNFNMPQMMGKPTFPEGPDNIRRRSDE